MTGSALVELNHVSKHFDGADGPTPVLRNVDFVLGVGEKASLVGPSGCGKSTLLSLICGLLVPTSGSVAIAGTDLSRLDDSDRAHLRATRIGIALQSDNLVPFLSASENIELAARFGGCRSRREARERAADLLDRFDVGGRARHLPRQLSGGEAQRVALAVSMANAPDLLLADEVLAQLDGGTAGAVIEGVFDADFAVLLVTHDIEIAALMDRRFELRDQRVVAR